MAAAESLSPPLQDFLLPLNIDSPKILELAVDLCQTFKKLAAESENQFLPTPISESILSPSVSGGGRYGMLLFFYSLTEGLTAKSINNWRKRDFFTFRFL